jgi:phenylalanyl-tRNA synthetase alpha chain
MNQNEIKVLEYIRDHGPVDSDSIVTALTIDQSQVAAALKTAADNGLITITEREREELVRTDSAKEVINAGLPERLAAEALFSEGGRMSMPEFVAWSQSARIAVNEALKWGGARGWIKREKQGNEVSITLTEAGSKVASGTADADDDYRALARLDFTPRVYLDELPRFSIDPNRVRSLLSSRPELAKIKKRTQRVIEGRGDIGLPAFQVSGVGTFERNALTPEDLESGAWRDPGYKLRPYDIKLAAKDVYPAKIHPLRKIIEQTRRAFLEMGFAEVVSPMVESAFWNFDALFQPQDHPARDMQDTFYMRDPHETSLPDAKIVEPVRRTHENGWETGSEGWGYTWSPDVSKQVVLRTHTTAATIRALAANPNPPGKFFCVGWTYRNETISFKHLPVFHQVDGIIIDEEANLASLMGALQEFYSKMGFGRVKFKPAFYPYTEPSVDVVVYMESRGKWLEMGGAGIFRPEVTLPLGCKFPVLAWGLGIERLAMLRFGLSDIRDLYGTNLNELEKVPLCR